MGPLSLSVSSSVATVMTTNRSSLPCSLKFTAARIRALVFDADVFHRRVLRPRKDPRCSRSVQRPASGSNPQRIDNEEQDDDQQSLIQDLRVPEDWLLPSKALQESEWLRVTLHKWLDDEYCPEATNVEISKVAAQSYYESLVRKQSDLGEILLKMARDLQSISYQESFHGAFSSANAAGRGNLELKEFFIRATGNFPS
ncbi:PREDICTED: uncharacterized protein LOC104590238 [Nelumbo nucifera]|uniref:Uncharacterized protein LOC104590238 n=1 Tax=Nelumbo nucifera TaxID=4432 RepID=A0A1U7ZG81_NELNU|nr:PREDICTED: uncharacterized protein LOC104590238 [Nelumbo nucifera]